MRKPFRISPLSLFDSFLWPRNRRRTPYEAYHDLLRRATFFPSTVVIRGRPVTLGRMQVLCSSAALAEDWGWNRSTVCDFFRSLAANHLATVDTSHRATILTLYPDGDAPLENKDLTQTGRDPKSAPSRQSGSHSTDRSPAHSKNKESLNSSDTKKREFIESPVWELDGPEFTEYMRSRLSGPNAIRLGPDFLPRVREAFVDKLITEGRLNAEEKDRILLSSNGI